MTDLADESDVLGYIHTELKYVRKRLRYITDGVLTISMHYWRKWRWRSKKNFVSRSLLSSVNSSLWIIPVEIVTVWCSNLFPFPLGWISKSGRLKETFTCNWLTSVNVCALHPSTKNIEKIVSESYKTEDELAKCLGNPVQMGIKDGCMLDKADIRI